MMKITSDQSNQNHLILPFLLSLCGYFTLHIILRVSISGSLDYDEAEQALLGQWLLPGYTEQPPLYTWLQYFLFTLFGENVFAISLLKNSLLLLTYICVFFAAREILHNNRSAILATVSLLFIPQIAWESQRDMTHTTLVVLAAAATLWQVMRLISRRSILNYCILGILLGVGILAKANFAIFITVLLLSLASFAEGRKVIFSKEILISLFVAAACSGTYVLWMVDNQDIVFSAAHKFKRKVQNYGLKGTISLFANGFLFLTPLWCICLAVFPAGFKLRPGWSAENDFHRSFIHKYMFFLVLVLFIVVIAFKVTYVKDRWLQPLLFATPIFFFARLNPELITAKRFKVFLWIAAAAALGIYLAFTFRVAGASYTGHFPRMNYPFEAIADDMRRLGFNNGPIISDDRFLAGNLHFRFPESTALIPRYHFEKLVDHTGYSHIAILWKAPEETGMPLRLRMFLKKTYKIRASTYPVHYLKHNYLYARDETVTLGFVLLPLSATRPQL